MKKNRKKTTKINQNQVASQSFPQTYEVSLTVRKEI
jgi:hypothetical protein